jgi:hypothetical protein
MSGTPIGFGAGAGDIGSFDAGTNNVGAFLGLGSATAGPNNVGSGNGNIGVFEGLADGPATYYNDTSIVANAVLIPTNGSGNIGAWNGNLDNGTNVGNFNWGAFNGNLNGNFNASNFTTSDTGNANTGAYNGNVNANANLGSGSVFNDGNQSTGTLQGLLNDNKNINGYSGPITFSFPSGGWANPTSNTYPTTYTGSINTVVLGTGSNTVTALGGLSTVVLGATVTLPEGNPNGSPPTASFDIATATGQDTVTINGSLNTVNLATDTLAGTHDSVFTSTGGTVDSSIVTFGNGVGTVVSLTGGSNKVITGTGGTSSIDLSGNTSGHNEVETRGNDATIKLNGFDNLVSAVPTFAFGDNLITETPGTSGNNSFVTGAGGTGVDEIQGFHLTGASVDTLFLQGSLAAANWGGIAGTLGKYLKVTTDGTNDYISTFLNGGTVGHVVAQLDGVTASLQALQAAGALRINGPVPVI